MSSELNHNNPILGGSYDSQPQPGERDVVRRRTRRVYGTHSTYRENNHDLQIDIESTAWQTQAACRDSDTEDFFSDDPDVVKMVKRICQGCPVRQTCLEAAIGRYERAGIWGGMTTHARRDLMAARRRAAS